MVREIKSKGIVYSFLVIVICAILCMGFSKSVFAASGKCGKNAKWTYSNGTLTISGKAAMKDYKYYHYNADGAYEKDLKQRPWLKYENKVTKIVIKDGITRIGNYAFHNIWKAKTLSIGKDVKSIGEGAFYSWDASMSFESITIPGNVKTIENNAFTGCAQIKTLKIKNGVQKFDSYCFDTLKLKNVVLPASVNQIHIHTFDIYNMDTLKIYNKSMTFFRSSDESEIGADGEIPKIKIYGWKDSTAIDFAKKYKIEYGYLQRPSITKITLQKVTSPRKGEINLQWKTIKNVQYYQIQISSRKDFTSSIRQKTYSANKVKGTIKIKGMQRKKRYYVRVRARKDVYGCKFYGNWSNVKSVTIK